MRLEISRYTAKPHCLADTAAKRDRVKKTYGNVVPHKVPIPLAGVEFGRKATYIAQALGGIPAMSHQ